MKLSQIVLLDTISITKWRPYLTPDKHRAKDYLQAIKEVVTNDNDSRTSRGPSLGWTNALDGGGRRKCWIHTCSTIKT